MIEGFDKEIDAILRKSRDSGFAFSNNAQNHLDADEISAFAENALPEKTKNLYTAHLADCSKCRQVLSQIILLNAEAENEMAIPFEEQKVIASGLPWYRRIFAFPNLAYSLGALVLVFGGLFGLIVLQNNNESDLSLSQSEPLKPADSVSSGDLTTPGETSAISNTMTANSAANMPADSNSVSVYSSNSAAEVTSNAASVPNSAPAKRDALPKERKEEAAIAENSEVAAQPQRLQNAENDERNRDAVVTAGSQPSAARQSERDEENKKLRDQTSREEQNLALGATQGETIKVGGKTFTRRNNVWYDSEYRNQTTINITRGTEDYKKLDQDLRQTVERLGGSVVVIWKGKAYRIQ